MRSLTAAALAKINQRLGTEPVSIVEIDWGFRGRPVSYADKDVSSIRGKIMNLSALDSVIAVSQNESAEELSLTLDDTDGSIKNIIDTQDIHQRDVRVYQWFEGTSLADKFLVFSGKISSPIEWREGSRRVSLSVVSQIEDREFGFSPEEGQFPYIPADMVGKPWPVIFGRPLDVPACQVNRAVTGSTTCPVGILSGDRAHLGLPLGRVDCSRGVSIAKGYAQISFLNAMANRDSDNASVYIAQANDIRASLAQAAGQDNAQVSATTSRRSQTAAEAKQEGEGCNPVRILGGEDFPQNRVIQLNIDGGIFTGRMNNDLFTITAREHPANEEKAEANSNAINSTPVRVQTSGSSYSFSGSVPPGNGNAGRNSDKYVARGFIVCSQPDASRPEGDKVMEHFWADSGSRVTLAGDEPIAYIASITPGTVKAVKAYKVFEGERRLVNLPSDQWATRVEQYGPIQATVVSIRNQLSTIQDQGWEDQIYVTFESSIGPNPIDILKWIINNYTDLSFDTASFNSVRTKVDNQPMNFAVLDRPNTLDLIKDIAYLARTAVWVNNGVVYAKYLPEEPTSDLTVAASDIYPDTLVVTTTDTETLQTKLTAEWRQSYAIDDPLLMPLRNNVDKYGTKQGTIDWFAHNQADIIHKALTFWLIRRSNSFKRVAFKMFLTGLQLETFDTITFNVPGIVATGAVKCIVEQANYDSANNAIDIVALTPVRVGERSPYELFWPANEVGTRFPLRRDRSHSGATGIGRQASGELPIGSIGALPVGGNAASGSGPGGAYAGAIGLGAVIVGGPNSVFRGQADRGDKTPWDTGFVPEPILLDSVFADIQSSERPNLNLQLNYLDPLPPVDLPTIPDSGTTIDIRKTTIVDSNRPGTKSTLDSVFAEISSDARLHISTSAIFNNGADKEAFDFKFDGDSGRFGAGTAFLQDD